jgi:MSHA pilin protein MshD
MSRSRRGFSLIEVVVFIVVLGIALVGMAVLYDRVTTASVDPVVRKQALAVATSLLEEIELRPFTFCDPDDSAVYTATGPPAVGAVTGCGTLEVIGVEGLETRYGNTGPAFLRFDNVSDYNGFCMGPGLPACSDSVITTAANSPVSELANYRVDVTVAQIAVGELNGAGTSTVVQSEGLLITVTAKHVTTGITVSLQGYRVRYAPNSP